MGPTTAINAPPLPLSIHSNAMQCNLSCSSSNRYNDNNGDGSDRSSKLEEPALVELKKKGDPDKLFGMFNEKMPTSPVMSLDASLKVLTQTPDFLEERDDDLLGLMKDLEVQPDEVTYNLVIKGFCQAAYFDMAKMVYAAVHGEGYKANIKMYQTTGYYLCKPGDFGSAYNMCKGCITKNGILNIDSIL
ncbi:hypothetical protein Cgig2_024336 [Carnegiea gigantea]|uniref:Pentatricopeptide repeat-containing protein n=1 Tax=Carnegiea gigantea TaxID=171969 RepID=A0A9Q1K219_9CARY|nr:hypothetical protein Cgig2_024336 [Carnegiea gigantea]